MLLLQRRFQNYYPGFGWKVSLLEPGFTGIRLDYIVFPLEEVVQGGYGESTLIVFKVHWYDYPGINTVASLRGNRSVNGEKTAYRNEQNVDLSQFSQLLIAEPVPQITQVADIYPV